MVLASLMTAVASDEDECDDGAFNDDDTCHCNGEAEYHRDHDYNNDGDEEDDYIRAQSSVALGPGWARLGHAGLGWARLNQAGPGYWVLLFCAVTVTDIQTVNWSLQAEN